MTDQPTYWIVLADGRVTRLYKFADCPNTVLMIPYAMSSNATSRSPGQLFRNSRTAKRAIERTQQYATEKGLSWKDRQYEIVAVRVLP